MDELDRLFSLLVAALAREARVAVPFPAADVYERLVPYRLNRSRLNVATHQDYEMAVLRLLAGERHYVQLEPENVREAMQREIGTINPDPAYFRSFPDAQVMVNGRAAERVLQAERAYAPTRTDDDDALPSAPAVPPAPVRTPTPLAPNQCEYCGGMLPANRTAAFCPHCGQPREGEVRCAGCGSPLDVGWAYCLACGRPTGFE